MLASVKKTGRIVIAGDATARGSFLNDLARNITELAFDYLDAPAVVLGSRDWITPAYELEYAFFRNRTASWTSSTKRSFRCRDTFRRVTTPMPNRSAELKKVSKDV